MKVHFERHGGFLGIALVADIDTAALPEQEAKRIADLVKTTRTKLGTKLVINRSPAARDTFTYDLQIDDNGKQMIWTVSDPVKEKSLCDLIALVGDRAGQKTMAINR